MYSSNKQVLSALSYENGYPMNTEYYTYYPTWFNGVQQTIPRETVTNVYGGLVENNNVYGGEKNLNGVTGGLVEEVVISGVSGRFQESRDVEEYAQRLYNGETTTTTTTTTTQKSWKQQTGGLDGELFGLNGGLVEKMDTKMKSLVEVTYEAIFDAGLNPIELKGSRTGVFVGTSEQEQFNGEHMLANKLSTLFELRGPSQTVYTKCTSSLIALDAAINAIKSGLVDYAIVAGVNGQEQQEQQQGEFKLVENVVAVLIQKKSLTRRFYAKVLHSKVTRDVQGQTNVQGIEGEVQARLLREIYAESDIDPSLVTYIETYGGLNGIKQHLNTISEVFASPRVQRTVPLFVGTSSSKVGHQEPVSGIFALVKMLISIQRGIIPANLDYQEPSQEVAALLDGRLKVVNSNTKFYGGLMALNSVCFGGANAHILLQPNNDFIMRRLGQESFWNQDLNKLSTQARLFQFGSRTQEGLEQIMEYIKRNPTDLATHFLVQPNSATSTNTHPFRGFTVLNGQNDIQEIQQVKNMMPYEQKPVWFVFSGLGTQWQGIGQEMMKIESFRESIMRSTETLRQFGLNVMDLIYGKQNVLSTPINSLVAIAAVQIALVDTLKRAGIEAHGMIGQSVGELGCAYADHTLTAEEVLMVAYYRGKSIEESQLPKGGMAVIGLTWEQAQRRLPTGVVIASKDGKDRVTVSGPKRSVVELVEQLNREGLFAKEIDSLDVAFHSQQMNQIIPSLKINLEKLIRSPKQRSSKWISTSIPEHKWNTDFARYSSADYHMNTLTSPVFLQEALRFIPSNAIVIEIGPQSLMQELLKKELSHQTTVLPMLNIQGQLEHFWTQLGRIYNQGINVDTVKLFVPQGREHTVYPVPVGTRFLSQLAKWNYQNQQQRQQYQQQYQQQQQQQRVFGCEIKPTTTFKYTIDLLNEEDNYLNGHKLEGRVVYPTSGYLYLIWKSLAKINGYEQVEQFPVTFENVEFHHETILNERIGGQKKVFFTVSIKPTNGLFELIEGDRVIVSGRIFTSVERPTFEYQQQQYQQQQQMNVLNGYQTIGQMKQQDEIYKELSTKGFELNGEFKPIIKSNIEGTFVELEWTGKWVPFIEAMLQLNLVGKQGQQIMPKHIKSLTINPRFHLEQQQQQFLNNKFYLPQEKQQLFNNKQWEQESIEKFVQWQEMFQQEQMKQQMLVQQLIRQPQLSEKHRLLLAELEQLIAEFQQYQYQPKTWSVDQQQYQQQQQVLFFEKLHQQLFNQHKQQKIFQQIFGLFNQQQQGTEQFALIQQLTHMVQEQQHFELEARIVEQSLIKFIVDTQKVLRQITYVIEKLVNTTFQGQYFEEEQKTLLQELEQRIQEYSVRVEDRKYKNEQRIQMLKYWQQQMVQQQNKIEQIWRQHQIPETFRQVVVELEAFIIEQIQTLVERQLIEKDIKQFLEFLQQNLRIHQGTLLTLTQTRLSAEEKRQILFQFEQFVKSLQQKNVQTEIQMRQSLEMNTKKQYKLEQLLEKIEQQQTQVEFYGKQYQQYQHQEQYGNVELMQLYQIIKKLNKQKQQLFWQLQQLNNQQFEWKQQQQPEDQIFVQNKWYKNGKQTSKYDLFYNKQSNKIVCGGIEIVGVEFKNFYEQNKFESRINFVERPVEGGNYLFVEKLNNCEFKQHLQQQQQQPNSELLNYYLNEIKRYTDFILRKIEQPSQYGSTMVIVPTPFNKSIEQQLEKLSLRSVSCSGLEGMTTTTTTATATTMIQGGKLLQLLIQAANLDSTDGQYFNKVQRLFNEQLAYFKALEEDKILSTLNKRNTYLRLVLDTILEKFQLKGIEQQQTLNTTFVGQQQQQQQQRLRENWLEENNNQQQFNLIKKIKIALGENVVLKVKDIMLATDKLTNEVLERNKRIQESIETGKFLVNLIENMKQQKVQLRSNNSFVQKKLTFSPLKTYIIAGELNNVAFDLVKLIVERGARFVVLSSKNAAQMINEYQTRKIRQMQEEFGVQITVLPYEIKENNDLVQLIEQAVQFGQEKTIGGIFHLNFFGNNFENQIQQFVLNNRLEKLVDEISYFVEIVSHKQQQQQRLYQQKSLLQEFFERRQQQGKHMLRVLFEDLIEQHNFGFQTKSLEEMEKLFNLRKFEQLLEESLILNYKQQKPEQYWQQTIINNNYLMPTNMIEKLNNVEWNKYQTPIVFIHPIEGHVNMLKSWAKEMNVPVYGVQYTKEAMQYETIEQLADFYWNQIQKHFIEQQQQTLLTQQPTKIHLIGSSFGGLVAVEISSKKPIHVASMTLLDTDNLTNIHQTKRQFLENPIAAEIESLYTFVQQYYPTVSKKELVEELYKLLSFDQRVKYVVNELINKTKFQMEPVDLEQAVRSYFKRMLMSYKYQPTQTIKLNEILLVKPVQQQYQTIYGQQYPTVYGQQYPTIYGQQYPTIYGQQYPSIQGEQQQYQNIFSLGQIFNGKLNVEVIESEPKTFFEGKYGSQLARILNQNMIRLF